ncbi:serine protease inhibitor ecotin [Methylobacillus caricis]|uniref:serine protease inhibitor ecotin n=1 Tax=Methylobacillus caricis TaxID=1971611 RepID=UPI001CFFA638|nr:serine protease inhibitor ecotin [Methylobacillus caricis]MCB5187605.1 serine protease inhibitor ecotin [Methylobacillus caricis]
MNPFLSLLAFLPVFLLGIPQSAYAQEGEIDNKAPYPQAEQGYSRYVIHLQTLKNEEDQKIELLVGKTMSIDCNRHSFNADLVEHTVQGWGYPYYRIEKIAGPISTRMACPEKAEREGFVGTNGSGFFLRYNSKLPVVVYVPVGFDVQYRIWKADKDYRQATEQ